MDVTIYEVKDNVNLPMKEGFEDESGIGGYVLVDNETDEVFIKSWKFSEMYVPVDVNPNFIRNNEHIFERIEQFKIFKK